MIYLTIEDKVFQKKQFKHNLGIPSNYDLAIVAVMR